MTITGVVEERIEIPEGVTVEVDGPEIRVSGPNGDLVRRLFHPRIDIRKDDGAVLVSCELPKRKEKALLGTYVSHIRNMLHGALSDFECKMKIVYSHFPMKVNVRGGNFVIENFMGERSPRKADIMNSVQVDVKGSDLTIHGPEIESVSQTAANIERATAIKGYDPRVFQDGIYIVQKPRRSEQ